MIGEAVEATHGLTWDGLLMLVGALATLAGKIGVDRYRARGTNGHGPDTTKFLTRLRDEDHEELKRQGRVIDRIYVMLKERGGRDASMTDPAEM